MTNQLLFEIVVRRARHPSNHPERTDLVKIGSVTLADYDYDVLNRRTQKTFSYPTTDQAAVYAFDGGNQLTSLANKCNYFVENTYDDSGRVDRAEAR